jgi:hypothetical protein
MGQEIVYCCRCQTRLTGADFEKRTAVRISNNVACFTCLTDDEKAAFAKSSRQTQVQTSSRLPSMSGTGGPAPGTTRRLEPKGPAGSSAALLAVAGGVVLLGIAALVVFALSGRAKPAPPPIVSDPPKPPPRPPALDPGVEATDFRPELDALNTELAGPFSQHNYRFAQAVLDRARGRHSDGRWGQAMAALDRDLAERARTRFKELKETASKAAERKAFDEVRDTRGEISRWGPSFQNLLREFEDAFGAVLAAGTPAPEPPKPPPLPDPPAPKPPDPAPAVAADPGRSEAGRKYLGPWERAMSFATRRDYDHAAADLQAASKSFTEEEVRKECAADVQDLERMKAVLAELLKVTAALPSWEVVSLEVLREDGTRAKVKGNVLQAGARRLELRGEPRYVELEDIAPASLVNIFTQKRGKPSPEDARILALLCALDGDLTAAAGIAGNQAGLLPPKVRNYASTVRGKHPESDPAARKNEWAARKLYYEAEAEFRVLESRGSALEKFARLLGAHADTDFVKRNKGDISSRTEEVRETVFSAIRMNGKGVFGIQKLQIVLGKDKFDMTGWKSREDPAPDDANSCVEVAFFALPNIEYKAWALVGGCCATTFNWFLQASELVYIDRKTRKPLPCDPGSSSAAPWDLHLKSLSVIHGGKNHARAEKEPVIWEWVELPAAKYAAGGPKAIRFMPASKGMAVAAVIVSSAREKRPTLEETRKLAEASMDEGVPTSALRAGKGEPDLLVQIPEARPFVLVYDLDLAKLKRPVQYDVDNRSTVTKPFDRIAYLLELQRGGGPVQYVFVSMDAFTDDVNKVGIPDVNTGAKFQQKIAAMNVHSNVEGVATGIHLDGGNIEFWPNNYGAHNGANVPGASNDLYDFGDQIGDPVAGHGSMQVHNYKAAQTIFAINKWAGGGSAEMGIGNCPGKNPDWTFAANAGTYSFKRLRVLVRPK